jgi:hypothetical protein
MGLKSGLSTHKEETLKEILTENGVSISGKKHLQLVVAIKTKNFEEKFGSDVCKDETELLLLLNLSHFSSTLMFALTFFELASKIMKCLKNSNLERKKYFEEATKSIFAWGVLTVYS